MASDVVSYRMIFVAAKEEGQDRWYPTHELWRQGVAIAPVPIEFSAHDAIAAKAALRKEKIDFCVLDAKLPDAERSLVLSNRNSIHPRPITIVTGSPGQVLIPGVDLIVPSPRDCASAFKLVNLCLRTKLPTRVLVVDDSRIMRAIICKVLWGSKFAFDISEAPDGPTALACLQQFQPNLVFLDFNMPGMNGFDVLYQIRKCHPNAGVVMITSSERGDIADRAHREGVLAFLRKPFYSEEVDIIMDRFYRFHKGAPRTR